MTESVGKRRLKDSKVFTWQVCLLPGTEKNESEQRGKESTEGRREGGEVQKEKLLFYLTGS